MMNIRDLIVIVMAVEFGLHYAPWRMLIGKELPRLAAYVLGLLGMMVPFSLWLMDRSELEILQVLWIVILAAGLTVFALYGLDRYLELNRNDIEGVQREKMMTDLVNELIVRLKDKVDEPSK